MKHKGPLITLLVGLVVAGVLYVLNVDLSNDTARNAAARNAAANSATAGDGAGAGAAATTAAAPPTAAPSVAGPGAPSAPGASGKTTYAGSVDGGAASVAIVTSNGKALAYVCDGKTAEAWLSGTAASGQLSLTGPKGSLSATYAGGVVTGTVTAGSKQWHFTIKTAVPPSGLYRSTAQLRSTFDASWVVLDNGQQVGVRTRNGNPEPAPPFDTATNTVTVDGTTVTVEPGNPDAASGS